MQHKRQQSNSTHALSKSSTASNGFYSVPHRTASPFAPPPLTGLTLRGHRNPRYQLLTRTIAEEIRLLLPPRLQLATDWTLAYSIEQDGVSLATLYSKCERFSGNRHGFVLVVKDSAGGKPKIAPPPLSKFFRRPTISLLQARLTRPVVTIDLRRLPHRPPTALHPLLWHRRMLPLARHRPARIRHSTKPAPAALGRHLESRALLHTQLGPLVP
ncbi:MAG: hypothetical protein LQ340_008023 [Diploschistes diacapsis]|nr:MAG: hypothetical protein LQ340_008023 [Diploschistes diacapsis]